MKNPVQWKKFSKFIHTYKFLKSKTWKNKNLTDISQFFRLMICFLSKNFNRKLENRKSFERRCLRCPPDLPAHQIASANRSPQGNPEGPTVPEEPETKVVENLSFNANETVRTGKMQMLIDSRNWTVKRITFKMIPYSSWKSLWKCKRNAVKSFTYSTFHVT